MAKSKAVSSRDAGDLEESKKAFAPKKDAEQPETLDELEPGVEVHEKIETPKKAKKRSGKKEDIAPHVPKKKKGDPADIPYVIKEVGGSGDESKVDPGKLEDLEETKNWRVQRDQPVLVNGVMSSVRAGQVVNRLTHNLDQLRSSGVVLEPVQ